MRRLAFPAMLLAALPAVQARPIVVDLAAELERAKWVFEAVVVEHVPERSATRVRVGSDPARIFRGFEVAGETVAVRWPATGPEQFQFEVRPSRRYLFVVRPDGETPLVGTPSGDDYAMRAFCDFNAAFVRIDATTAFDFESMQTPSVPGDTIGARTGSDPRREALLLGPLLLVPPGARDRSRFDEALADLAAEEWSRRDRAERARVGPLGLAWRDEIARFAATAESFDVRDRLRRIESALGPWVRAEASCRALHEPGPARWRVFVVCLRCGDAELAAAAHGALRSETGHELPESPAAWEEALPAE